VSKSCADLIAQSYAATYNLPVTITRCGNFYGGGDLNWNRIVPGTIRTVMRGTAPVIRSDGAPVRDYFYVEDGAAANMHLAMLLRQRPELAGEAFNFSNSAQVTVNEIVALILERLGRTDLTPVVENNAPNEIKAQYLDPSKAKAILGWNPEFSLEQGLDRTIAWYRTFLSADVG
jgi:CDP-glucose 4,6-dehydratase